MSEHQASIRSVRWWAVVYAFFVTPLDFGTIGLADGRLNAIKWLILLPAWYLPVLVVTPRWPALMDAISRPPMSWLLAWAGMAVASPLWAIDPQQAILMGLGMAGLIILGSWYVYNDGWYGFATAGATGLGLYLAAGVCFDIVNGQLVNGTAEGRAVGLASGATSQGRLAAFAIILAVSLLVFNRSRRRPMPAAWAVIGIGTVALAFSETRTAILAVLIGLLYGGIRRYAPFDRWLIVGGLALLALAALGLGSGLSGIAEFSQRNDPTSVSGRTEVWPIILDIIAERPLIGYGWGAEETLLTIAAREGEIHFLAYNTHALPLTLLISGGVVGFSLLACAVGGAIRRRHRVNVWIVATLVVLLFSGTTEALFHRPSVSVLLMAGVLAAIARVPRSTGLRQRRTESAYLPHAGTGLAGGEPQSLRR